MATRVRPRTLSPARRDALLLVALFAAAALISGFTMLRGIEAFDEGLMLQAARRIVDGQVPYRDFLWSYGPAQPYLLGGLFKLFGTSLIDWRILRVIADAGVALMVFVIARREAGPRLALVGWFAAACIMAQPRSANPFPPALLAGLGAVALVTDGDRELPWRRVAWAAVLTAVAAAFRLDFGIYAALAATVALLARREWRPAAGYVAAGIGLVALAYLPFLIAIGPSHLYDALIGTSLREKRWWTLPFPWTYDGPLSRPRDVKHLIDYYVPALLVIGVAVGAVAALLRWRRDVRRPPATWLALLAFAAGGVAYLLSRTDEFHTTPLYVLLAILLPMVAARAPRPVAAIAVVVLALFVAQGGWNRASALVKPGSYAPVDVAVADGVEAPPDQAGSIERMVRTVQQRVPPGDPIYVAPLRSDLVRINAPIVYVLTDRDNPLPRDFGLETGAPAQAEIVDMLRSVRPRVVVRWTDPIQTVREPNLRGRPSGVHTLDRYLATHYRLLERDGYFEVLVPR